jgi:secondary thiamine-phosphate synthase enzyme
MDITEDIKKVVKKSGILNGIAFVFSLHTTCAIKINENEPLLLEDFGKFLNRLAPVDADYKHNDFSIRTVNICDDECKNGHAHCQHILMGTSEYLPVKDGDIVLGQWQRILLVELDREKERKVLVEVLGV